MQIIAQTGEEAAFIHRFERHQRPVRHDFVTIVKLDFPYPLMSRNRRFQLFLSSTYLALMLGTSVLGKASQKSGRCPVPPALYRRTRYALFPLFAVMQDLHRIKVLLPPVQQLPACSSRPFGLSAPITTAIKRR